MTGPGGMDLNALMGNMMKQAEQAKQQMEASLREKTVEGSTGGGLVKVTATGAGEVRAIKIDPSLIDPAESEMLEDLLAAAVNVAMKKANELREEAQKGQLGNMMSGAGGLGGLGGLGGAGGLPPELKDLLGGLGG